MSKVQPDYVTISTMNHLLEIYAVLVFFIQAVTKVLTYVRPHALASDGVSFTIPFYIYFEGIGDGELSV